MFSLGGSFWLMAFARENACSAARCQPGSLPARGCGPAHENFFRTGSIDNGRRLNRLAGLLTLE